MSWMSGESVSDEPGVGVLPWGKGAWALVVPAHSSAKALYEAMASMPGGLRFADSYGGTDDDHDVVLVYEAGESELTRRLVPGAFLRAMLELDPATVGPDRGRRWMTDAERQAYQAGKADLADALRRQVVGAATTSATSEETAAPSD